MNDELLEYIIKSKSTRQVNEILESLRQTATGWLIIYVVAALALCFFGYRLRRVLPFFVGLAFGFAMSCILNKLIVSGDRITIDSLNAEISSFITSVKAQGSGFLKTFVEEYRFKSLAIPITSALTCACLSVLLYKFTMAAFFGVLAYSFAGIYFIGTENAVLYSILIGAGCFLLLLLFYNIFFILFTAAAGAAVISLVIASTESVETKTVYIIAGALCAIGAAAQYAQFFIRQRRLKRKRAAAKAKGVNNKKAKQKPKQRKRKVA